jgi:hypothetical protein
MKFPFPLSVIISFIALAVQKGEFEIGDMKDLKRTFF